MIFLKRQLIQRNSLFNTGEHQSPHNPMSVPECNSMIHQIVSRICRIGKTIFRASIHVFFSKFHRGNHTVKKSQAAFDRINGIKSELLVFLHILIIGQGYSLHRGEYTHQSTIHAARLSPHQLCNIWIFFLRHDATASTIGIVNLHELIFIGVPQNDLLAEPAQMHHDRGHRTEKFNYIIPVRD